MDAIDYDEMAWDEPADGTQVTVACVRCGAPIEMAYDTGEPTTRDHPGAPATWYAVDTGGSCEHIDTYSREEEAALTAAADRAASAAVATVSEPIGTARAVFYLVDCPIETCGGYLTTTTGDEKWQPEQFTPVATGHCDECGQTFKVRR